MNQNSVEYRYEMIERYFKSGSIGAEIGVYKGSFSYTILTAANPSKLYLVDPWKIDLFEPLGETQESLDKMHNIVVKRFKDNPEIEILRETSVDAAPRFADNYFDWVYIDGDHTYEGVLQDILTWFPKVKEGGWICGDDYNISKSGEYKDGVILAVHAALNQLGSKIRIERLFGNQFVLRKKGT